MCSLRAHPCLNLPLLSPITFSHPKFKNAPSSLRPSMTGNRLHGPITKALSFIEEFPPNALHRVRDPQWRGGFSLGVDLGLSRTGLALSKGYSVRPLTVLNLRGQKLELRLLEIAEKEEVDEFIIGLPKSCDGEETPQSNKVRSVAGRLAIRAAERGWRVYLQDEHGTSAEAADRMIYMGLSKSARQTRTDAYAAVIVLERYFSTSGQATEIVFPKQMELQEKLRKGAGKDIDFFPEEFEG
ncbi:hypothetical protein ACOSQ2_003684 [Xanthoceras sorbifolium]